MARQLFLLLAVLLTLALYTRSTLGAPNEGVAIERIQRDMMSDIMGGVNSKVQTAMKDPKVKKRIMTMDVTKVEGKPAVVKSKTVKT